MSIFTPLRQILAKSGICVALLLGMFAASTAHADGRVSANQYQSLLYISGDADNNSIRLYRDAFDQLIVLGLDGTRVGNFRGKAFVGVDRVVIYMDEGHDSVRITADLGSLYVMSDVTFVIESDIDGSASIFSDAVVLSDSTIGGELVVEGANGFLGQRPSALDESVYIDIDNVQVQGDTIIQGTDGPDYLSVEASTFEYFQADLHDDVDRVLLTAMNDDLVFGKLSMLLGGGYDVVTYAEASFQGVIRTHRIRALDSDSAVYGGRYWETSAAEIKFDNFYSWTSDFGTPDLGELIGVDE